MYRKIKNSCLCFLFCLFLAAGCSPSVQESETILQTETVGPFSLEYVPAYSGDPAVVVNGNVPFFTEEELESGTVFESYSSLDALGRCGPAFACVGKETQPEQERTMIDDIHPSGWQNTSYDFVDKGYLYNRCHLIAYSIAGENDNERNLITGTRYFNAEGMLPYENMVLRYVQETGGHVLYRVSPIFEGENLVASGALMEAYSLEDAGKGLMYCVYVYNVQPFVVIDYKTGESRSEYTGADAETEASLQNCRYILNISSRKIHMPDCESVAKMSEHNKKPTNEALDRLEANDFAPCQSCMHDEYLRWKDQNNHDETNP